MKLILALIMTRVLAGQSASILLQHWCATHHQPPLIARRARGAVKPAPPAALATLHARPGGIAYRRVRLTCGQITLSVADNWYVPARLTPEMNRRLRDSEAPFGLVARPLRFHRRTLEARGRTVRAVLIDGKGRPFSYVAETYAKAVSY